MNLSHVRVLRSKTVGLFLFLSLFYFSSEAAENSGKEVTLLEHLFQSLNQLDSARRNIEKKPNADEKSAIGIIISEMTQRNLAKTNYDSALRALEEFKTVKDKEIGELAEGLKIGILSLTTENDNQLKVCDGFAKINASHDLKKLQELNGEMPSLVAKSNAKSKEAWELLAMCSSHLAVALLKDTNKIEKTLGETPYRISEVDRKNLLNQFDLMFKQTIEAADTESKAQKQGKSINPNDLNLLSIALSNIREHLSGEVRAAKEGSQNTK